MKDFNFKKAVQVKSQAVAQKIHRQMHFLSDQLLKQGINLPVDSESAWVHFNSLTEAEQLELARRFEKYFEIVSDITIQGIGLSNTIQSLWRIFKRFDWMPESDLLSRISEGNVVEIYLPDNTQLYRNGNYFKYTSYTLSDLSFLPWNDLIEHGPLVTQELMEVGKQIFVNQVPSNSAFKLTPYVAKERHSERKYEALLESKFICPIRSRSHRVNEAALVVWDISLINETHVDLNSSIQPEMQKDLT